LPELYRNSFSEHITVPLSIKIRIFYIPIAAIIKRLILLTICLLYLSFCDSSRSPQQGGTVNAMSFSADRYSFPYALENPDKNYKLPSYLEEISGLSYYSEEKLACIQDEKANIYILKLGKKLDISKYDFGKDGDYEGIAIVKKTAYVIRNDGRIFRVRDFTKDDIKTKQYKTPLSDKNDTEGLEFDQLSNSLLIACKGSPSIKNEDSHSGNRAVYRFDLDNKELAKKPFLLINLDKLDNYKDESSFTKFSRQLAKTFRLADSKTPFQPSGIAIHPLNGDIYLISSIGKLLIVMNRSGKILYIHDLDANLFRQPEGICFSPSGVLYISNEGQGGKGYILKFKPLSNE